MKRLLSLLALVGLTGSMILAQGTTALSDYHVDNATEVEQAVSNSSYVTQKGNLALKGKSSSMTVAYTLYPQPATMDMALTLNMPYETSPKVYLTDTEGNLVNVKAKANISRREHYFLLNLRNIPEGMYYLHVKVTGVGESDGMPIIKLNAAPALIQ